MLLQTMFTESADNKISLFSCFLVLVPKVQLSADQKHSVTNISVTCVPRFTRDQVTMLLLIACLLLTTSGAQALTLTGTGSDTCGLRLAATCRHVSKRIVCGQDHCAQLSPHHAILGTG